MRRLIVGVGSAHGDDQIGWTVLDILENRASSMAKFRKVVKPIDMLDWLGDSDELIIIDGVEGITDGSLQSWVWPNSQLSDALSGGTHGLGLNQVLELAEELLLLPKCVTIVGVPVSECRPIDNLSASLDKSLITIIERIEKLYA
jgi:hydrogenase maturation protease